MFYMIWDVDEPARTSYLWRNASLILSAITWGFGANSSNPGLAARGKLGVVVACAAAILCGAAVTLVNFFWHVGQSVPAAQ